MSGKFEKATLGGGCFWCMEAVFSEVKGVEKVESGFSGGWVPNPTYEQVCTDTTGHAEVVQITFDPSTLSYDELLDIYFGVHDPTTLNRQGDDVGTQYRSVIFYHTDEQKRIAESKVKSLTEQRVWKNPIVTEIQPYKAFYRAEEYHQSYFRKNPDKPYCRIVISPKVSKLRHSFQSKLRVAT